MTNSIFAPFCKPHKMLPAFSNKSDHIMREVKLQQLVELKLHCIRQLVCYGHWHGFFFSALSSFWGLPGNARWVLQLNMWHVCCHRCDICLQNRMWCWLSSCNFLLLLTHTPDGWVRCDRFIQGSWALREEEEDCLASVDKANIFNVYSH